MYEILTDNTADLFEGYYDENPTHRLPLSFIMENRFYEHDEDFPLDLFYQKLKEGHLVKTSQVNPHEAEVAFDEVLFSGKDLLYISFSSGMSGSYSNIAYIAKGLQIKYPDRKIFVIDSLSGGGGEGLLVYYAKKMQQEGKSIEEVAEWLEENKHNVHHLFIVNDLANLKNSGRISTIAALLGMIVSIKPVLDINVNGGVGVVAKALGRKKAIQEMCKAFEKRFIEEGNDFILIGHTNRMDEAEPFGQAIQALCPNVPVKYGNINRLVAGNAGYNALAVFFLGKKRVQPKLDLISK